MSSTNNTKEARKRKATSRLEESDEVLAKKLKEAQGRCGHVHPTSKTSTNVSQTSSTVPSTWATTVTFIRQTNKSSLLATIGSSREFWQLMTKE
jgi:hypothetical protein